MTLKAEPDGDLVYGDAAQVIVEWRKARAESHETMKSEQQGVLGNRLKVFDGLNLIVGRPCHH